jgi:hypothetical protein
MTAEHSIAPLAVDILPFADETNCDTAAAVFHRCPAHAAQSASSSIIA